MKHFHYEHIHGLKEHTLPICILGTGFALKTYLQLITVGVWCDFDREKYLTLHHFDNIFNFFLNFTIKNLYMLYFIQTQ